MNDEFEQFRLAIANAGLTPPDTVIDDGNFHRFVTGPKRNKNGWYVMHRNTITMGTFGDWAGDIQSTWCSVDRSTFTPVQKAEFKAAQHTAIELAKAELKAAHDIAATQAKSIWDAAVPATAHDYLAKKGIGPNGARLIHVDAAREVCPRLSPELTGPLLVIPIRNGVDIRSLQFITEDGVKRPLTGGEKRGCYFALGTLDQTVVVAEGFATGASIRACTGHAVAVALDRGNLKAVAQTLRLKLPSVKIIIAADDDYQTTGNPGLADAKNAAQAVGGTVALPVFKEPRQDGTTDFNDLHTTEGMDAVEACFKAVDSEAHDASGLGALSANHVWPEPREIKAELPAAPPFDASVLLPKALADFVLDEADRMPCPPDYVAAALIVALGSVIGTKCALKPKRRDDWIVTPNLYGGVIGDPSAKKTPAVNLAMRFLDRLEAKESELLLELAKIYEAEMAAFEAHQGAVKACMKKAASGKTDTLKMTSAIQDMQDLAEPEKPHPRRFKSNDATTEKLGDLLTHNQFGMLVFRDELIGLLSSWDKEGKEGDRAFYLEGWNGTGSFSIDRIARGSLYIKNLCLSVFGGIQPDLLERYLGGIANSLDNDGRIQRFQVLVYPNAVGWEWRDRYPVKGAREAVRDVFDRLASFDPLQDGASPADDFVKLSHFCFDDEAQELFIEWSTELHRELIAKEQNPLMQQHFGKFEKLFCALALILHLAEGNIGNIKFDSAVRAAAWCEYLAGHARRIYGLVEVGKITAARSLGRRISEGKLQDSFTARDVSKKGWANVTTTTEAENALSVLEDFGWVLGYDTSEQPGRPTTRYRINPKCRRLP